MSCIYNCSKKFLKFDFDEMNMCCFHDLNNKDYIQNLIIYSNDYH